jgi:hypothetical protein
VRLRNVDLGVKAVFKQVTPEEFVERMKKSGLPDHIAVAATELCQALIVEDRVLGDESVVSGKVVSTCTSGVRVREDTDWMKLLPKGYKFKSWEEYVREENWSLMV